MSNKERRTFSAEFKLRALQMLREQGLSASEVCRDMKLGETAVRRWLTQVDEEAAGRAGIGRPLTPEQQRHRHAPVACLVSAQLKAEFAACGKVYGSCRLEAVLRAKGLPVGRHRVRRLMRQHWLCAVAAQVHPHDRQRPRLAGCRQHPGSALRSMQT